jgi:hypothetical protein
MKKIYPLQFVLQMFLSVIIAVVLLFSCKKNPGVDNLPNTPNPPDLTTKINASLVGFVTDDNDVPMLNATVQAGAISVTTDKYGYFEIRNTNIVQQVAVVTISKPGYFKAIKTYVAVSDKIPSFRVKLIPKTITGTLNGSTGGTLTLSTGLSVTLPANGVVNATTGIAYTGTVNLASYWINPVSTDLPKIMPGDLRGVDTDGNIKLLTTYGMAAVELTGSGGELLQIATGKKATLSFPVTAAMTASAPASIKLWYFNENNGLWKEEGLATRTGNNYIGEVSHFSYWNCDVPNSFVQFNCTLVNQSGQPLQNALVKISRIDNPYSAGIGFTDSTGYTNGIIPDNTSLLMEVFTNTGCTNLLYSQQFATGSANLSLGTITVNTTAYQAAVTGTVTSCSGTPVTNGNIYIRFNNQYNRYPIAGGSFNINTLLCTSPTAVSIIADDPVTQQQSTITNYNISAGANNIGNIQACGVTAQQYMNYSVNGVSYSIVAPQDTLFMMNTQAHLIVFANNLTNNPSAHARLEFSKYNIAAGAVVGLVSFSVPQKPDSTIFPGVNVNITEYGNIGEYISGNFAGVFTGTAPANTPYNVTCNFRIKRYF